MTFTRNLLRVHAHAWFVCGALFLAFLSFIYLKILQIYFELSVDESSWTEEHRWSVAWSNVWGRRMDNPSLWALVAAAMAAWLLTRASAYAWEEHCLASFVWMRSLKYWIWLTTMLGLSIGSYLVFVRVTDGTFWYSHDPQHQKYLLTAIPRIQQIEGAINILAITLSCSLVPIVRSLVDSISDCKLALPAPTTPSTNLRKARARLATIALGPFTLLTSAYLVYKVIKWIWQLRGFGNFQLVHTAGDIGGGIAGALFICLPMLIATKELWYLPRRHGISAKTVPGLFLFIWLGMCVWKRDMISPPGFVVDDSLLPQKLHTAFVVLKALGYLGGVLLWFIP